MVPLRPGNDMEFSSLDFDRIRTYSKPPALLRAAAVLE
jgi:hypothetical protein